MRRQIAKLLGNLKQHWTLLVVSHDAGDLLPLADRCWKIDHGELKIVSLDPEGLSC
jgi:energy-coupling factor transport system ATP-binding protein